MAARMAMIATTTNSSISVNARVPGRTGSNDFMVTRYYFDSELRKVAFFEGSWNCVSIEFSSDFRTFCPSPHMSSPVLVGRSRWAHLDTALVRGSSKVPPSGCGDGPLPSQCDLWCGGSD